MPGPKRNQELRIILAIFPIPYLVIFSAYLFLVIYSGAKPSILNTLFNFVFVIWSLRVAALIHDLGHLSSAKLLGAKLLKWEFGIGRNLIKTDFKGTRIIINSKLRAGNTYVHFMNIKFIKGKWLFYKISGPLANVIVALLLLAVFGFDDGLFAKAQIASMLIVSNFFLAAWYLNPLSDETSIADKLSDANYTWHRISDPTVFFRYRNIWETNYGIIHLYKEKSYSQYLKRLYDFAEIIEDPKSVASDLAVVFMKLGQFRKARTLMEGFIRSSAYLTKLPKSMAYGNMAWMYLILDRWSEALKYSSMGFELNNEQKEIRQIHACCLIGNGKCDDGLKLLDKTQMNEKDTSDYSTAIFSLLGYYETGDLETAVKHHEYLTREHENLDPDDKAVYELVLKRTGLGQ